MLPFPGFYFLLVIISIGSSGSGAGMKSMAMNTKAITIPLSYIPSPCLFFFSRQVFLKEKV